MHLDAFKLAAKRLRKQFAELTQTYAPSLEPTQSQALEMMARILGYRDFHEARARLDQDSKANPTGAVTQATRVLGIVAGYSSGKTLLVKNFITRALAEGRPVRVLETYNTENYRHFVQALGGQMYDQPAGDAFFSAWCSDASLVCATCDDPQAAHALNFGRLKTPGNALFVCDEARHFGDNFQAQGQLCILVSQLVSTFPVRPAALLDNNRGPWELRFPEDQDSSLLTELLMNGMTR